MKMKLISLVLVILCLGGLFYGASNFIPEIDPDQSDNISMDSDTTLSNLPLKPFYKFNSSYADFGKATVLSVNSNTSMSAYTIFSTYYQVFRVDLIGSYYLNLTLFDANWKSTINTGGNLTNYVVDIDMALFFSNQSFWMNVTSNNIDEILSVQIPQSDTYYIVVYPFESDSITYGTSLSYEVLDQGKNTYNETIYGDNGTLTPHATSLMVQMMDGGTFSYGNNLDVTLANTTDVLSHMPTLHTGLTTWLWEHDRFGLPVNDLYKVFVPANTSITVTVTYGPSYDVFTTADVNKYEEVISLINYNRYLDYLHGSYSGSYNTSGLNDAIPGGASAPIIYSSQILNLITPADADSWYIFALNNSKLNYNTFEYTIEITMIDYIDYVSRFGNDSPATAYNVSNLLGFSLGTNNIDEDYFVLTPVSQPLKLTVNIFFDRNYGKINLYVFNRSLGTYPNDESKSLVGKSDFSDQNQQTVIYNIYDLNEIFIKINSSVQYSNIYQLNVSLGTIDDQYEPNNDFFHPATLYNPDTYQLYLTKGDYDYFRVFLFKGDSLNVTINFDGSQANLNLFLYDEQLAPLSLSNQPSSDNESVATVATKNAFYYFIIYGSSATFVKSGIDYSATLAIVERDDYLEPNDNKGQSAPIQDGYYKLISRAGDEDWFNIYMRTNDYLTVSVTFDTTKGDIDVFLYNIQATTQYASSQTFTGNESLSFTAPSEGQYLLRIALFDGLSVNYNLNITLTDENYDQYEDNDDFSQAYSLEPGFYTGIIAQGGDHDFFKVNVPSGYAIIVELLEETPNTGKNFRLTLYSSVEVEINRSERNLNTQLINPVPVSSATHFFIDSYYKGFGKNTYSLNISLGLNSVLFPTPKLSPATSIPSFTFSLFSSNTTTTTSSGAVFKAGDLLMIGVVGIAGGVTAGAGGTVIGQKASIGTKFKKRISRKK